MNASYVLNTKRILETTLLAPPLAMIANDIDEDLRCQGIETYRICDENPMPQIKQDGVQQEGA